MAILSYFLIFVLYYVLLDYCLFAPLYGGAKLFKYANGYKYLLVWSFTF